MELRQFYNWKNLHRDDSKIKIKFFSAFEKLENPILKQQRISCLKQIRWSNMEWYRTRYTCATIWFTAIFYLVPFWNETIDRYTKIFTTILFVNTVVPLLPPLLYSMINYYFLDTEKESFFLFFRLGSYLLRSFQCTCEIEIFSRWKLVRV